MSLAHDNANGVRFARVYDEEIVPAYASRFAALILRRLVPPPGARVVEIGCATGHLTRELARRFDRQSRISAFDASAAFVAATRAKLAADPSAVAQTDVALHLDLPSTLPFTEDNAHLVVSNLALADAADPVACIANAARAVAPGGRLVFTSPLRGSWGEFLDLLREALREAGHADRVATLDRHIAALPDERRLAGWLERAGLAADVEIEIDRWQILFRSAREFFFAPLVERGPFQRWKNLTGGGDAMQDVFFFAKQAIDAYYKGHPFAVTIVGAVAVGRQRPKET